MKGQGLRNAACVVRKRVEIVNHQVAVAALDKLNFGTVGRVNSPSQVEVSLVDGGKGLRVKHGETESYVHSLWFSERTRQPAWIHEESNQKLFEISDYVGKDHANLKSAKVLGSDLELEYCDGYQDKLDLAPLLEEIKNHNCLPTLMNDGSRQPVDLSLPELKLWGKGFAGKPDFSKDCFDYNDLKDSKENMLRYLQSLKQWGAAVVKNVPRSKQAYQDFLRKFGIPRETNWGTWFEVSAALPTSDGKDASVNDVANTNLEVPLHTDGPYNALPLNFQVLQVLKQSAVGGGSTLSDGVGAAEALRREDPEAFEIIANTSMRFRYQDDHNDLYASRPMIVVDPLTNQIDSVFFSSRVDAIPTFSDFATAEKFYAARKKFLAHLYDQDRLLNFKLQKNDMLIFDNRRMMHGRAAFSAKVSQSANAGDTDEDEDPESVGADVSKVSRLLRGCYLDSLENRYRTYKRIAPLGSRSFSSSAASPKPNTSCSFVHLKDCTPNDVSLMNDLYSSVTTGAHLADRAIVLLKMLGRANEHLEDAHLGAKIDLMEHGLQTATRCFRDGCDEEVVVAGLLHDVGELLSPSNHGEVAASLLRPFVSPQVSWMLAHHEVFQMYYYNESKTPPGDPNVREVYRQNEDYMSCGVPTSSGAFDFTVDFCEKYDQASFDPDYSSMELCEFVPMVERVFARDAYWHTPHHPKRG
eukprot:CAMPEP_0203758764 /NCGR_PEP_ID=MMETSP0098-20131031/11596_1 /ASSEMBLY_ACC=CAM_ASM_000208 /TAXON_ID=96639 /ORGANISM=" , Strain NY0313808BC1" /LENGTH=695 /DNA_ID=CAMNT_0050651345 /DNA_START=245 /DNA_END=2329 /DNA_ORIENTATION=-